MLTKCGDPDCTSEGCKIPAAQFTPVAKMALIVCETVPGVSLMDACKIAVAFQTEGYCKAPF